MRIRHITANATCRHEVAEPTSFHVGSMLSWFSLADVRQSRYEGWHVATPQTVPGPFMKILDRVDYLKGDENMTVPPAGLTVTENEALWEYDDGTRLSFSVLPNDQGLRCDASRRLNLRLTLDVRGMYETPALGRDYRVTTTPGTTYIEYADASTHQFIALKADGELQKSDDWEQVAYPWDAARNSQPTDGYVYILGTLTCSWFAIGTGSDAPSALRAAEEAALVQAPVIGIAISRATDRTEQIHAAQDGARHTLNSLWSSAGITAGSPWFHQVWSRDELIAALGLEKHEQLTLIERYLTLPLEDGELPTFLGSGTTCADGLGWLALVIREYGLSNLPDQTKQNLRQFFTTAIRGLASRRSDTHLIYSGHNATWMDTIGRTGYRIEIQAMYQLTLRLLEELDPSDEWAQLRKDNHASVRLHFLHPGQIKDGHDDSTLRPNIFLAYLLAPTLFTTTEWERGFGSALTALRTTWGGLSSIDKRDPRYVALSTGQTNESYHNGDSWFFVNNLAALALHRFGMQQFTPVVEELIRSSTEEILWKHTVGRAGEIASASNGQSWGCGVQAFSAGAYLFATREIGY